MKHKIFKSSLHNNDDIQQMVRSNRLMKYAWREKKQTKIIWIESICDVKIDKTNKQNKKIFD